MTPEVAVDIFSEALSLIIMFAFVIIMPSLLVGLVVSIFQAATQINEQTLSFLPKLLLTLTTMIVIGPWLVQRLMEFTTRLISSIPLLIG